MKRVLSVGNCIPDHGAIRDLIESNFDAQVDAAGDGSQAVDALAARQYDLILVNRLLDCDGSPGLDVLHLVKGSPQTNDIPVMLLSNYAEHQETAVAAGAEYGFGKGALQATETLDRLRMILA